MTPSWIDTQDVALAKEMVDTFLSLAGRAHSPKLNATLRGWAALLAEAAKSPKKPS